MPVIKVTAADKLASKILDKGTYRAILVAIDEPKESSSKKSYSYQATFKLSEGLWVGKKVEIAFNTGTRGNGVLGDRQFMPTSWIPRLQAAILDKPIVDGDEDVDTDILLNRSLDLLMDVVTSDGNLANIVTGFAPEGKGTPNF